MEQWGAISLYTQLNMTKQRIKELLDAGYDKLVVPYYLHTDNNSNVAITGVVYHNWSTAEREKWSEFNYDLKHIYDNYDRINGTNYGEDFFLRLYPDSAGTYELYISDCEVTTSNPISAPAVTEADKVIALIDALPVADSITLDDKDAVTKAKNAYDALSTDEKKEVTNVEKLNSCVAKIEKLEASKKDNTDAKLAGTEFDAWSGNAGLWIGSNGDYSDRLKVEAGSEYKGQPTIAHVTINHKADGSGDLFKANSDDMFYTSYAKIGITKEELQSFIDAGYSKLQVSYYYEGEKDLCLYANYEGKIGDADHCWDRYVNVPKAEKNKWATFDINSSDLMHKFSDDEDVANALKYLIKLSPSEQGIYNFYLGTAKFVKDNSKSRSVTRATTNTDWSMFSSIIAKYSSILGELSFDASADKTESITGDEAVYKACKDITSKYAKGGSIKLYTPLAVRKSDIERWIKEGYDKLEVPYFIQLDTNESYGAHAYAMDKKQYSQSVSTGTWNVARLDLEYIKKNFDKLCDAEGDNYLLRIELKKAGNYTIYLGDCKPMADATVTLNNGICFGYVEPKTYNGTVDYEVSTSDYIKENLLIDNKTAKWCTKISIPSSVWNSEENAIQALIKPCFSKEKAIEWKNAGYSSVSIPYYIKSTETGNYSFLRGISEWTTSPAVANKWSTIEIPLDYIIAQYDNFKDERTWTFALYIPNYGDYEIYFDEGEVIAECASEQETVAQLVKPGNISYWANENEYSNGSYNTNVTVADRVAESYATINIPGSEGVITYYYTLNFDKAQIQKWIDAGYTHFKIPYYLEGSASQIWGQKSHSDWSDYIRVDVKTKEWSEFSISLADILDRYDYIQMASGENYLFRISPTAKGTVKLAIGQCGVYKQATKETKTVATYTDTAVATSKNIVTDGSANYNILIPKNAGNYVKTAAEELKTFIKESTGAELDIVSTAENNYISLGNTKELNNAGLSVAKAVKGTEGYQINTVGDNVYIYADKDLGVVYGVYGYLERTLNYDYFYKDVFTIDKNNTAKLYDLDVTDVPDIATRIASYSVTDTDGWLYDSKERLRVRMETYIENMTGALGFNDKGVEVAYSFHNSLNYLPKSEYGTNTSWYYTSDKKTQLCYNAGGDAASRDKMENIVAGKMFETLTKYKNYNTIVFAAEDNEAWCTCDACKLDVASYGAKSATLVRFCNEVAAKLEELLRAAKDPRTETFKLAFYAYNATEEAPVLTSTNAEGNITYSYRPEMKLNYHAVPFYAPINADFSKSLKSDTNKKYYENLKKWNAIANEVYMEAYDSFFNNRGYLLPYNSWDSLSDLYKTAYENGVTWMYNLGQENNSASSGFSLLKVYLESKLAWDINADVKNLTDKFFAAMYGNQANAVKDVYNSIKTHMNNLEDTNFWPQVNSTHRTNDGHFNKDNWPKNTLTGWLASLQKAENDLKDNNSEAAKRVRLEEANVLSLLMECHYIITDNTTIEGGFMGIGERKYNTLSNDFKNYRSIFTDIVNEWNIKNAAENDWTMDNYIKGLNN